MKTFLSFCLYIVLSSQASTQNLLINDFSDFAYTHYNHSTLNNTTFLSIHNDSDYLLFQLNDVDEANQNTDSVTIISLNNKNLAHLTESINQKCEKSFFIKMQNGEIMNLDKVAYVHKTKDSFYFHTTNTAFAIDKDICNKDAFIINKANNDYFIKLKKTIQENEKIYAIEALPLFSRSFYNIKFSEKKGIIFVNTPFINFDHSKCKFNLKKDSADLNKSVHKEIVFYYAKQYDNLYTISNKFNISVNRLKEINKLNTDLIDINQKIRVSDDESIPYNDVATNIVLDNKHNKKLFVHQTQQGQTLYSIAKKYKISLNELYELNDNLTDDCIDINQKIIIKAINM